MTKPSVRHADPTLDRGLTKSGPSDQLSAEPVDPDSPSPGESYPEPWDR
jgi:hypothetical protein